MEISYEVKTIVVAMETIRWLKSIVTKNNR
jgi:hypothetical protein